MGKKCICTCFFQPSLYKRRRELKLVIAIAAKDANFSIFSKKFIYRDFYHDVEDSLKNID
jgi:hypothetical protein